MKSKDLKMWRHYDFDVTYIYKKVNDMSETLWLDVIHIKGVLLLGAFHIFLLQIVFGPKD